MPRKIIMPRTIIKSFREGSLMKKDAKNNHSFRKLLKIETIIIYNTFERTNTHHREFFGGIFRFRSRRTNLRLFPA